MLPLRLRHVDTSESVQMCLANSTKDGACTINSATWTCGTSTGRSLQHAVAGPRLLLQALLASLSRPSHSWMAEKDTQRGSTVLNGFQES